MRRLLGNLALALASLTVVLGLAELGVRVFLGPVQPRNLTLVPSSIRAPAPFRGVPYLMQPDAEATQDFGSNPRGYFDGDGTLTYHTNSLGWRSPEFAPVKPEGTFRILGLGDSFTFGTGVRREDTFLSALDASLAGAGLPVEVVNLGVMGFNTAHELVLLKRVGVGLDPDLVVICYVLNDAEVIAPGRPRGDVPAAGPHARVARGEMPEKGPEGSWMTDWLRGWPSRSLLVSHVLARLDNRRARERGVARILADYRDGAPGWVSVQHALRAAAALARQHGFPLVLMIFPNMWELNDDYPFAEAHAKVRAAASGAGIPVLDLLDAFRGEDGVSLWVHPSNQHPNERAHAIAAAALERFLRERGLLPTG